MKCNVFERKCVNYNPILFPNIKHGRLSFQSPGCKTTLNSISCRTLTVNRWCQQWIKDIIVFVLTKDGQESKRNVWKVKHVTGLKDTNQSFTINHTILKGFFSISIHNYCSQTVQIFNHSEFSSNEVWAKLLTLFIFNLRMNK